MGFIFYGASGCASWCSVPVSKESTIAQLCSLQYTRSRRRGGSHSTVPALGSSAPFSSTPILQSCSRLTLPRLERGGFSLLSHTKFPNFLSETVLIRPSPALPSPSLIRLRLFVPAQILTSFEKDARPKASGSTYSFGETELASPLLPDWISARNGPKNGEALGAVGEPGWLCELA